MGKIAKQMADYMRAEGFVLVRQGRHHVWHDGKHTVVTSVSPSCERALLNTKSTVRRMRQVSR